MEEQKYDDAAKYYNKAANYKPNKYFSPGYLMKEALAYEKLNQNDKARETYDKIINRILGIRRVSKCPEIQGTFRTQFLKYFAIL